MPGVEDFHRQLAQAGVKMASWVGPRANVDMVQSPLSTGTLFAATASADDVTQPKPAPDESFEAADRMGSNQGSMW